MIERLSGAVLVLAVVISGCSTDKKADAAQPAKLKDGSVAPRPTVVSKPTAPYQATTVSGGVKLTGTLDFDGVFPADTVIQLPADAAGCGQRITDHRVQHTGTRIGGAIVWITDIRTGKPLPLGRRFELVNEDCMLSPQVQAVVAPATLNVASEDVALHRDRIINVGTGELEGIAPFNDNGEVVPFDRDHVRSASLGESLDTRSGSSVLRDIGEERDILDRGRSARLVSREGMAPFTRHS
jgi:hypothetical protein